MESILRLYLVPDPVDQHATYSVTNNDAVSSVDDLQDGRALKVAYATWEDDEWLLDGNYHFLPATNAHVGYWSTGMTNSLGKSSTALGTIRLDLDADYDLDEIIIHGDEATYDYCTRVIVQYYNGASLLETATIYPNEVHFKFSQEVSGVNAIVFSFYDTNKPYRRIRVTDITFGDTVEFRADQIKSASVIMEQSPLSDELPYGTMSCELMTTEPMFDLIDPDSLYNQLKTRMMMDLLYDNGKTVDFIGRYYLTGRSNESDNHIKLEGMDLIGLLEEVSYNGDFWRTDEDFATIVNRILSFSSDVGTVTVDSDVANIQLRGNIEPGNLRIALQQVLFAAGCSAEIVDGNNVHIMHQQFLDINGIPDGTITKSQKALEGQLIKDTTPATRLEVTSHSYVMAAASTEIFKETLNGGTYTLYFDTPAYFSDVNVTNATLISSGPNYAIIEVTGTKEVTITGSEFSHNKVISARDIDTTGLKPNIIKVQDATMISPDTVPTALTRMEFFYLLRYEQNFRAFNPAFYRPGYIYHVDTIKDRKVAMIMKQTQIDLSGGFICDMSGVGVIVGNVLILKKDITIGDKGNVIPAQFEYPREGPQSFISTLFADYQEDYGIGVTINGVRTVYMDDSAPFVLASSNASTSVAIDFPQITKAITIGTGGTVTPAKFKFPWAASQNFTVKLLDAYKADYGIGVSIDGVRTLYMTTQQDFTLSNTTEDTAVVIDFPLVTKAISIGDKGTVTPAKFKFPMSTPQQFTVALLSGYSQNDYYISVNINGTVTDYREVSTKTFSIPTTTASTSVSVTFPAVLKKAITKGSPWSSEFTVTPASFNYPWTSAQNFVIKNNITNNQLYYIQEKINGVAKNYDITERTMVLTNTTASTTVEINLVGKSSKTVQLVGFDVNDADTGLEVYYCYPVAGNQTLYAYYMYISGYLDGIPELSLGKADFRWYVDGVLKSTQIQVAGSYFTLTNATASTVVRCERENEVGGGGSSGGGGGGGGYTPWTGTVNSANSALRTSQWTHSSYLVTFLNPPDQVLVTGEVSGSTIFGFPYPNLWYSVTAQTGPGAGLSGYIHSGLVSR